MHADMRPGLARRPRKPLIARGGIARTFGSLAGFLALTFLCFGAYLFEDAFSNPLAAETAGLIGGAVIIALATVLVFYIFHPNRSARSHFRNTYQKHRQSKLRQENLSMATTGSAETQQETIVSSAQQKLPSNTAACAGDSTGPAHKTLQARGMAGK